MFMKFRRYLIFQYKNDKKRFLAIAKNIAIFLALGLAITSLLFTSSLLQRVTIIVWGLAIIVGSQVDSEENSKRNRKIGPWAGGLLSACGIFLLLHDLMK